MKHYVLNTLVGNHHLVGHVLMEMSLEDLTNFHEKLGQHESSEEVGIKYKDIYNIWHESTWVVTELYYLTKGYIKLRTKP